MSGRRRRVAGESAAARLSGRAVVIVLIASGLLVAVWFTLRARARSDVPLLPVPEPDLSGLPQRAVDLIGSRRAALDAVQGGRAGASAERARAFGDLGLACLACGLDACAEACLVNAGRLAPRESRWPHALGELHRTRGEPEKAAEAYGRAASLEPEGGAALVWAGLMRLEAGRHDLAEPLLERAATADPRAASALWGLGRIAMARGDHARAIETLEAALRISPEATALHALLAVAYGATGETARAERHRSLGGDVQPWPNDPVIAEIEALLPQPGLLTDRGLRALRAGRWAEAAGPFARAVELEPDVAAYRLNLGVALHRAGDARAARAQFEQALRIAPEDGRALMNLGVLAAEEGRGVEAIALFRRALGTEPLLVEAHLGLADELQRAGRYEEALPHYEQARALGGAPVPARIGLALTLARLGRWQRARSALEESLREFPEEPMFRLLLARLLATCPRGELRDGERALRLLAGEPLPPPGPDRDETMAMALAETGRFEEAVRWQTAAITAATERGLQERAGRMRGPLALYESRRACRDFWLDAAPGKP